MRRLTASEEDYLEAIRELESLGGPVRVKDVAASLSVRMASVTAVLKRLVQLELVEHERYGSITLTSRGRQSAERILNRHLLLHGFFHEVLGVSEESAAKDACAVEHALSDETIDRLLDFLVSSRHLDESKRNILRKSESADGGMNRRISMSLTLDHAEPGKIYAVEHLSAPSIVSRKLRGLGIDTGRTLARLYTPSQSEIAVSLDGLSLRISLEEASFIHVARLPETDSAPGNDPHSERT